MWKFNNEAPIYNQIVEQVESKIISGEYPTGSRFPSVRELAFEVGVNPNTMQKAMAELERRKLVETIRNSGRLVTQDSGLIGDLKFNKAAAVIVEMVSRLNTMGYSAEEITQMVTMELKKMELELMGKS